MIKKLKLLKPISLVLNNYGPETHGGHVLLNVLLEVKFYSSEATPQNALTRG